MKALQCLPCSRCDLNKMCDPAFGTDVAVKPTALADKVKLPTLRRAAETQNIVAGLAEYGIDSDDVPYLLGVLEAILEAEAP
jgi:hypothetical protein